MVIKDERNCGQLAAICKLLQKQGYSVNGGKGTVCDLAGQGIYQVDLEIKFKLRYSDDVFQNLPKNFFWHRHTLAYRLEISTTNKTEAEHSLILAMRRLYNWVQKNEGWAAVHLLAGRL